MFAPGARSRSHVPNLTPLALTLLAVFIGVFAWALASTSTISNDARRAAVAPVAPAAIRSVAYTVAEVRSSFHGTDVIYIRPADGSRPGIPIKEFPYVFGWHTRGESAPTGDRLAVVHVGERLGGPSRLTIITLPTSSTLQLDAGVDHFTPLAWAPDASRIAAVRTDIDPESGDSTAHVILANANSGASAEVARFEDAIAVAPVGFSYDGERLFIVVVDGSGSTLWERRGDKLEAVHRFSPGPTRDWVLSPDGSRLAFVDRLGVGGRTYAGRVLTIATGAVSDIATEGDQLGAAWRLGAPRPDFGGPAGTVRLSNPGSDHDYLVPIAWAPDGETLVAAIYSASSAEGAPPIESIQLVPACRATNDCPSDRQPLADVDAFVGFLGWVRDVR